MPRLIARLGEFVGRKCDREPGAEASWLGREEVHVAVGALQKSLYVPVIILEITNKTMP